MQVVSRRKANTCVLYQSFDHDTTFCHLAAADQSNTATKKDICFQFNPASGCPRKGLCCLSHICKKCKSAGHSLTQCKSKSTWLLSTTLINIERLEKKMYYHPDRTYVDNLIKGIKEGFDIGVKFVPTSSFEWNNAQSALKNAHFVTETIKKETELGYLAGPFEKLQHEVYRVSPIGVAKGKYSKKKRLILDLSSPHDNS